MLEPIVIIFLTAIILLFCLILGISVWRSTNRP